MVGSGIVRGAAGKPRFGRSLALPPLGVALFFEQSSSSSFSSSLRPSSHLLPIQRPPE
jgi:hypothetical protein